MSLIPIGGFDDDEKNEARAKGYHEGFIAGRGEGLEAGRVLGLKEGREATLQDLSFRSPWHVKKWLKGAGLYRDIR